MAEIIDIRPQGKRRAETSIWAFRRHPAEAKTLVVDAAICGWLRPDEAEEWIILQGWEAA